MLIFLNSIMDYDYLLIVLFHDILCLKIYVSILFIISYAPTNN
jgi:hypothetical protein